MPDEKGQPLPGEWWGNVRGPLFYMVGLNAEGKMVYQKGLSLHIDATGVWFGVKHLPDCTGWNWQPSDWVELDPVNYGWHKLRCGVDQCRHVNHKEWKPVELYAHSGWKIDDKKGNWEFRCLRKDLPQKPPEPVKPDPGEGWRLLEPNETLAEGDEFMHKERTDGWLRSYNLGAGIVSQTSFYWYRRKTVKSGPTAWHTTNEDKVLIWGAIHNIAAAIGGIKAQLEADRDRDKFFQSVM